MPHSSTSKHFDPDAPGDPAAQVFGLPDDREAAAIELIPVPFEATTSYRSGTLDGPRAIRTASTQVDLNDRRFGEIFRKGIWMDDEPLWVRELSAEARSLAEPIIDRGGSTPDDKRAVERIDEICTRVHESTEARARAALLEGKLPGIIGGEHAVSIGGIRACATHAGSIGILQIDAHMDLRPAYQGFTHSHASIMHNALLDDRIERVVQVGIRDFGVREGAIAESMIPRVRTFYDDDIADEIARGRSWHDIVEQIMDELPDKLYVTVDIDGLDPTLCPNTGTPVPGGLSFQQLAILIDRVRHSDRTIVGFDLVEVCPGGEPESPGWDAIVGARVLYRLCSLAP